MGFFMDFISDEGSNQMNATIAVEDPDEKNEDSDVQTVNSEVVNVKTTTVEGAVSNLNEEEEDTVFSPGQVGMMMQDYGENSVDKPEQEIFKAPGEYQDNNDMGKWGCGSGTGEEDHEKSGVSNDLAAKTNVSDEFVLLVQHGQEVNKTKVSAAGSDNQAGARMEGVCGEEDDQVGLKDESESVARSAAAMQMQNNNNILTNDEEESKEKDGDSVAATSNVKLTRRTGGKTPHKLPGKQVHKSRSARTKKLEVGADSRAFSEMVCKTGKNYKSDSRFSVASILGLGEASVAHLDDVFQGTKECAKHSNRKRVMRKDFDLVRKIWLKNGMM